MKNLQIVSTFAIAFFFIATAAMAQDWNINQSGYLTTTNARVGIGLTNPDQKLHISASNAYAQLKLQRTGTHAGSTYLGGSEYGLTVGRFLDQNTDAGAYKIDFVVNRNGRVGIGMLKPESELHLMGEGDISLSGNAGLLIGAITGTNLGIDANEIQARHNGNRGKLLLNQAGGNVTIGESGGSNLGIGTPSPKQKLSIKANRPRIALVDAAADAGIIEFHEGTNQIRLQYWKDNGSQYQRTMMSLDGDSGGVGVGTDNVPSGFRFAVDGKAIMEELKIQLSQNWADYVFQDDYNLVSLEEVEQTIDEKGHLHNIASAAEIKAAGGIEVGDITVNQQEKIEELFLHMIEMNKKLKATNSRLETLEAENAQLKTTLVILKTNKQ